MATFPDKNMTKAQRIAHLKAALFSDDWETAERASDALFHFGGRFNKTGRRKSRLYLLRILDQEQSYARNAVAMTFRKNRFNTAVIPLLRAITKPENSRTRGKLAFALETLNCSQQLGELFAILFGAADNWMVQASMVEILEEQIFVFTKDELHGIERGWNAIRADWNRLNTIDEDNISEIHYHRALIQDLVDGFLAYLK